MATQLYRRRFVWCACLLLLLTSGCSLSGSLNVPSESWESGVQGFEKYLAPQYADTPLLIAFLQTGCGPCERLTKQVLFNDTFIEATPEIEKIAIDLVEGDGEKHLARQFRVTSTPTLFLVVPEKKLIRKVTLRKRRNNRVIYPKPNEAGAYLNRLLTTLTTSS